MTAPASRAVRVERRIDAPPEAVYAAWTDPESLRVWMAPDPLTVGHAECDVRVGGRYRIVMVGEWGAIEHSGEYEELTWPSRLVFTWRSANLGDRTTRVSVDLAPVGGGTHMVITHDGLPDEPSASAHREGWTSIAGKLQEALAETA